MKITKKALQKIIKEEYSKLMIERELRTLQESEHSIAHGLSDIVWQIDELVVNNLASGEYPEGGELLYPIGVGTWDAVSHTMDFLESYVQEGRLDMQHYQEYLNALRDQAEQLGMHDIIDNVEGGLRYADDGRAEEEAHSLIAKRAAAGIE